MKQLSDAVCDQLSFERHVRASKGDYDDMYSTNEDLVNNLSQYQFLMILSDNLTKILSGEI